MEIILRRCLICVITALLLAGCQRGTNAGEGAVQGKSSVKYDVAKDTGGNALEQKEKTVKDGAGWRNFKKPNDAALKKILTPMQYKVTQKEGTEPPFRNEYDNNHRDGIYVDVVSGEPLFSSTDKFDSGTGWPSFKRPLEPANVVEKEDRSLFGKRIEVRSKHGDSHLGHVFPDGPPPTGLRYCMNSAALRFIEKEKLSEEGYPEYLKLFEKKQK